MKTYRVTYYFTEGPNADENQEIFIESCSATDAVLDGMLYHCYMSGSGFATVSIFGYGHDDIIRVPFRKDR